jgi:hypothetical protein
MTASASAAYAALPQTPDAAFAGHSVVPTSLTVADEEETDGASVNDDGDAEGHRPQAYSVALDGRIRWVLFALGAAVLLPWNGVLCRAQ